MHHKTDIRWLTGMCKEANSFAELSKLALKELSKFPGDVEIVCGPISTGGRGVEENLKIFFGTIKYLQRQGKPIFNQEPYEERLFFLKECWERADPSRVGQYCMPVLEEFYLPIFETGRIRRAWFIPRWESSFGAKWEHKTLLRYRAEIHYLADWWPNVVLAAA